MVKATSEKLSKKPSKSTVEKFHTYKMDRNWQRLGKITSENLKTFLAITKAKIKIHNKKNQVIKEFLFKENSQISIKEDKLIFKDQDVNKITIKTTNE